MVKWWNAAPSPRDQRRTDPVHPPKPPGKKDKARWCKGKTGVEHVWVVTVPDNTDAFFVNRPCQPQSYSNTSDTWSVYFCKHRVQCQTCGRVKRRATKTECASGELDQVERTG